MAEGYESFLEQMKQGYQQRTGIPVDSASDVGIRFAVLAEQLALLQQELETAQQQAFAQTATGQALEMHAAQRGLSRKQAVYASGTAVFSREEAAQADIPIPQGCFLTEPTGSIRYTTEQEAVLKAGQTQVEVPVRCQTAGSGGNVAAGRLSVMVTPVQGIAAVSNPQPILSGEDAESDQSLRQRLPFYHPAASAGDDLVKSQEVLDVAGIYAAGWHEFHAWERSSQSFDSIQSAVLFSREEFYNLQAILHCGHYFGRSTGSREYQYIIINCKFGYFGGKSGRNQEFGAGIQSAFCLLYIYNGSGSNQHFRKFFYSDSDGLFRSICTEGNLCNGKTACTKCFTQRFRVLYAVQFYNGNNFFLGNLCQ